MTLKHLNSCSTNSKQNISPDSPGCWTGQALQILPCPSASYFQSSLLTIICALLLTSLMCVPKAGTGNHARHNSSTVIVPEVARPEVRGTLLATTAMHCNPGASTDKTFQATKTAVKEIAVAGFCIGVGNLRALPKR